MPSLNLLDAGGRETRVTAGTFHLVLEERSDSGTSGERLCWIAPDQAHAIVKRDVGIHQ